MASMNNGSSPGINILVPGDNNPAGMEMVHTPSSKYAEVERNIVSLLPTNMGSLYRPHVPLIINKERERAFSCFTF